MSRNGVSLPPSPPEYRASGLLLHVTSLSSPYGIGGGGPAALACLTGRVFFAVKVQPRIHREAAKSAKSAKISRRKILSCQQRIFELVVQDRSSFVTWPGRPCHDAIVTRVSRRG